MSFRDDLSRFTAAQIIKALGCPRGTAYDWLDGRRQPPDWQHPHWLAILRKKANKTVDRIPIRGDSQAKK